MGIRPECFGTRHTFVLMSALGMTLAHMLRVDISVAIVSMVNTTSADDASDSFVCAEDESGVDRQKGLGSAVPQPPSPRWGRGSGRTVLDSETRMMTA